MPTFAVHYVYDDRTDLRDEVRPDHRRYLAALVDSGELLASGPFTGPTVGRGDEPDGALLLVRADSPEGVAALLDDDPFMTRGLISARTVRPWNAVMGPWAT